MKSFFQKLRLITKDRTGSVLLSSLVLGMVAMLFVMGLLSYSLFEQRVSTRHHYRDLSLHIAEAGINYYRWHLAHDPSDYTDGTGQVGPYEHEYRDKDGDLIGYFSLEIDEPLAGSTVVTIRSTGWTVWQPESRRTIQVRVGFPGLTDYTFLSNANMNFGFTTEVHGAVHSNGGIRFDGTTDSWVSSAKDRYQYQNQWHNGVWGSGEPKSFWRFPVPQVDFESITADLSVLKTMAEEEGVHLSSSGQEGWHFVFRGDEFDVYRVLTKDCYYGEGRWRNRGWSGWYWDGTIYCYDIGTEQFVETRTIPENGAIFVEDTVWVDGVVGGRASIGVGRFPVNEPYQSIIISGNLSYEERSTDHVLGLMSQGDIIVPYETPDVMTIDAAMLSQFKKIYRPFYDDNLKDTLTIFGSQISYEGGGWKYNNGWGNVISGYENTVHTYDGNLKYYPPPGFPVEPTYQLISWEEL